MEEVYNQAQRHWMDNMISACQDYERHEDERSDFLRGQWLQYIEMGVGVNETSAMVSNMYNTVHYCDKCPFKKVWHYNNKYRNPHCACAPRVNKD